MRHVALLALGTALVLAAPAMAQEQTTKPLAGKNGQAARSASYDPTKPYPAYTAPRLKIGQPDLQGVWSNATLTPPNRPAAMKDKKALTEAEVTKMEQAVVEEVEEGNKRTDPNAGAVLKQEANLRPEFAAAGGAVGGYNRGWLDPGNSVMRVNGEPRTSLITTPNGQPPARKAGATNNAEAQPSFYKLLGASPTPRGGAFDNPESRGSERCITGFGRNGPPPMFANGFYNNNYQIVQSPSAIMIDVEMIHDARIIRLNAKHRTDDVRPYFGDSIGWFDGDTLVVETDHFPQSQAYAGSWKNLKVTEKFKRVAADRLLYQFTVEDPDTWDTAWGGEYEFHPLEPARLYEYACHEGNYALHGVLSGARVQEAREAAAKPVAAKPAAAKPAVPAKQ